MVRVNHASCTAKIIPVLFALSCGFWLKADTKLSAESSALWVIVHALRDYQTIHEGHMPANWEQLSEVRDIEGLNRQVYPVKEHYVFITNAEIPLFDAQKGDAVLIRTDPEGNASWGEDHGRYIISRKDADFFVSWMPENKVQTMLAGAGIEEVPRPGNQNQPTTFAKSVTSTNHSSFSGSATSLNRESGSTGSMTNLATESSASASPPPSSSAYRSVIVVGLVVLLIAFCVVLSQRLLRRS